MRLHRIRIGDEALWVEAVASLVPGEIEGGTRPATAELTRAIADRRWYAFVALVGTEPVGFLSAYRFPDALGAGDLVYLCDIVVREGHRRRGIGSALVEELIERCRSDGARRIWAGTTLDNVPARRTFEGSGAVLAGETYAEYEWTLAGGS